MNPNDYLDWCSIKNTAKNLVQENKLPCAHSPKKKILKGTKLVNKKLRQCSIIRTYSHFIKCKKKILKNLTEYQDMTDVSDISGDHDSEFYNCSKASYLKDSNVNYTDDCFSWLCIEKRGTEDVQSEKDDSKTVIENKNNCDNDNINDASLHALSNSSSDNETNLSNNLTQNNVSPKVREKKNSLNMETNVNKKHLKYVKKIEETPTRNNNMNDFQLSDEWEDEFIASDFQGHSTKIFSSTISEMNKKNGKSKNRSRLSKTDVINQPRDSDESSEEDTRRENKLKKFANNINKNKRVIDAKSREDTQISLKKVAQKNLLDKVKSMKSLNNLNDEKENKANSRQMKKSPLKTIGQEKGAKKYKIIDSGNKGLNLISKEQNSMFNANKSPASTNEVTDYNGKRSPDKVEKCKEIRNELYNLNDSSDGVSTSCVNNESDRDELISETEEKEDTNEFRETRNSISPHPVHQRRKLRQMSLINSEEDMEYRPDIVDDKEISIIQKDKAVISNIVESTRLQKNKWNNEDVKINDQGKAHENNKNLISSNRRKSFQRINLSQLSSDESSSSSDDEKVNTKAKNSLKTPYIETNKDEQVHRNKKAEQTEKTKKNTKSFNMKEYFQPREINKTNNSNASVTPDAIGSQKNTINTKHTEIDESTSCDKLVGNKSQPDFNDKVKDYKKTDFAEFSSRKCENIESDSSDNQGHFISRESPSKRPHIRSDESKVESKGKDLKGKSRRPLELKSTASPKNKKENGEQFKRKSSPLKEKRKQAIDDIYTQSGTINNNSMITTDNEMPCKMPKSNLSNDARKSDKSNNDFVGHSNDNDADTEKSNASLSRSLTKNRNIKDTDARSSNINVAHKIEREAWESCTSSDDDTGNAKSHGKLKESKSHGSQATEDDREIDVNIMSPQSYKRLKAFKRLDLFKSSEEESDKDETIRCEELAASRSKRLQKNCKSSDSNSEDDEAQELNVERANLSPNVGRHSKSLERPNFSEEEDEKPVKLMEQINNGHEEESVDEDNDEAMSMSTMQKLSQFKKLNFLSNSESSSEDDSDIGTNSLVPKNAISQRDIVPRTEKPKRLEDEMINSNDLSNIKGKSLANKSLNAEASIEKNKAAMSTVNKVSRMKGIKGDKKGENNIEEVECFDEGDGKNKFISDSQETLYTPQVNVGSQEIFSSEDDTTSNGPDDNNASILDIDNPSTGQVKETGDTEKMSQIADIVKKENLTENCCESTLAFEDISPDEEIFILDIPKAAFEKNLVGEKLSFSKSVLQLGDNKYNAFQRRILPTFACVLESKDNPQDKFKLLNIRPTAAIVTRKKNSMASIKTVDLEVEEKDEECGVSRANGNKYVDDSRIDEAGRLTELNKFEEADRKSESSSSASLRIEGLADASEADDEYIAGKRTKSDRKNLKRKSRTDVDGRKSKKKGLDDGIVDKEGGFKKLKPAIGIGQTNANLNDMPKKVIKSNSKFNVKNFKLNPKLAKKREEAYAAKDEDTIASDESLKTFSPKSKCKTTATPRRKIESESEDSNFNITIDNTEEREIKSSKALKSKKRKRSKKLVDSIGKEAIEQIINIVRNNIKFRESCSSSSSSDDSNGRPSSRAKRHSAKKQKRLASSSSDENDKKYLNRSFQILDRSKPQPKKGPENSLSFQQSRSGTFVVKSLHHASKKIYFDE